MIARDGRAAVAVLSRLTALLFRPSVISFTHPGGLSLTDRSRIRPGSQRKVGTGWFSTEILNGHVQDEQRRVHLSRILYRSRQRGFLELDLVLGKWVEENITKLDDVQLEALVQVLDEENPDLWKILSGQEEIPAKFQANPVFVAIHKKVQDSLKEHASDSTRAHPGSPWLRGWDDISKATTPVIGY